jgi:hypothetical protein
MRDIWRSLKKQFYHYRIYRENSPNPGFSGEGKWLEWLAIPSYIVSCETQGYVGMARYHAVNPSSSAGGTYQILPSTWVMYGGHGSPSEAPPWEQAKVARSIWVTSGAGQWACS